jgi:hypothetical protein
MNDGIGPLASQLSIKNQSYVLNTINALLFAQQDSEINKIIENKEKLLKEIEES